MRHGRGRHGPAREGQKGAPHEPPPKRGLRIGYQREGNGVEEPGQRQRHPEFSIEAPAHPPPTGDLLPRELAGLPRAQDAHHQRKTDQAAQDEDQGEYPAHETRHAHGEHQRRRPPPQVRGKGQRQRAPERGVPVDPPLGERGRQDRRPRLGRPQAERQRKPHQGTDAVPAQPGHHLPHQPLGQPPPQHQIPDQEPQQDIERQPELAPEKCLQLHRIPHTSTSRHEDGRRGLAPAPQPGNVFPGTPIWN